MCSVGELRQCVWEPWLRTQNVLIHAALINTMKVNSDKGLASIIKTTILHHIPY